jgi:hypothetical protein
VNQASSQARTARAEQKQVLLVVAMSATSRLPVAVFGQPAGYPAVGKKEREYIHLSLENIAVCPREDCV